MAPTAGEHGPADAAPDALPDAFHQSLFPPVAEPAFEHPEELERTWGARWGASNEVGRLRAVLMRRPGPELELSTIELMREDV